MVLLYDIRCDECWRKQIPSSVDEQWTSYLRGDSLVDISEGRITELFYAPYEGEHMFRLDDGKRTTAWVRQGEDSWFVVGRRARVEHIVFHVPPPIGDMPVVTRIWIGEDK